MKKFISILFICLVAVNYLVSSQVSEFNLKGAFLYHFLFFVEWPNELFAGSNSINVGILGTPTYADILKKIKKDETVDGKEIRVEVFKKDVTVDSLKRCHLLFIDSSFGVNIDNLLQTLDNYPILTVSDIQNFGEMGGMIALLLNKESMKFEINRAAAERVGIKFRSKLLRLAVRIIGE